MSEPKRVFLIDSMSHIFRAFYAPMGMRQEPLRNSSGQVTQAVFVFTNMLRKLIADEQPDYVAAVFDTPDPTFRHEQFEDYKANREEMPEDLAAQIPYIERVCEAFNVPILKEPGFEADDIIGTLAKQCEKKKLKAVIVSNDKDLCQLVSDPYVLCMRQNSQNIRRKVPVPPIEWCDEAWVQKKFELPPEKIVDYLGLMGDSIDNIPGAPGIGAKGALKILNEFGSAEEAMANAEKVKHKTYRESLQNNQDLIRQSVELATIHTGVDVTLDLKQLKLSEPDRAKAYELFRELEFNTLTREFADAAPLFESGEDGSGDAARHYSIIKNRDELDKLIRSLWEAENWSFDVDEGGAEFSGSYSSEKPVGISIATAPGVSYYIDFANFEEGEEEALKPVSDILSNGFLEKCAYDYKRNLSCLSLVGITPSAVHEDALIAAYLIDSGRRNYELRTLAQQLLKQEILADIPDGWQESQYRTAERADFVFQLTPKLSREIEQNDLTHVYREIELPLIPILFEMEMKGMKVDKDILAETSEVLGGKLEELSKTIFELGGREFNINSPKQVAEVLQELNIETKYKTPTGKISTSKDALNEIGQTYEIANHIIEYRELDKLKSTYADSLPSLIAGDGRIHSTLNQAVAATGRLSSTDPNLQNIPIRTEIGRQIRKAFVAEDGNILMSADYSQLELRIIAHITGDEVMREAFENNEDIHAKTAKLIFGAEGEKDLKEKRRLAKIVNFGIAYAVEAFGLSQRTGLSRSEAKKVIEEYYATYKGVKQYMDDTPQVARDHGYVSTIFGRRRYLPSIKDRNFNVRSRAEREAINMPIQGTASDIVKIAMLKVDRALKKNGFKARMLMQVHDELLLEVPNEELEDVRELLIKEMESAAELEVPLVVETGTGSNWMELK
ncbi:MAG: DNA polymerase I [Pyrinomonadaceae bacterium]|nr:DNA polymerase I [Pyrinomonadaceae bacterium]